MSSQPRLTVISPSPQVHAVDLNTGEQSELGHFSVASSDNALIAVPLAKGIKVRMRTLIFIHSIARALTSFCRHLHLAAACAQH